MSDRRAELEKKKQKLALIREEKERRRREKEQEVANTSSSQPGCGAAETHQFVEQLMSQNAGPFRNYLGNQQKQVAGTEQLRAQTNELLESLGIPTSSESGSSEDFLNHNSTFSSETSNGSSTAIASESSDLNYQFLLNAEVQVNQSPNPRKSVLTIVNVHQMNIPPKENVTYNKQTQTAVLGPDREARPLDYYVIHWDEEWDDEFQVLTYNDVSAEEDIEGSSLASRDMDTPPLYPPGHHHPHKLTGLPNVEMVRPAQGEISVAATPLSDIEKPEKPKVCELSEEEKKQIMLSEDFHNFFDRATRIIERSLGEEIDVFADYSGSAEKQEADDKTGVKLCFNRAFYDDRWSKHRTVTSFDWSSQFPELLAASYNNNDVSPLEPDGVCLIWNMKFKKRTPEYIFHCPSAVMSTCFAKFHPNLILGGTYSGQIVLWDNRSNKRTPVQRSPLSAMAHTHPVYCIQVVGTQNAHNVVTVSTDGKFCSWSLDMLSSPQDTMELSHQKLSRAVSVTTASFPLGDYNNFIVGSEEGAIYTACRHGSKAGILDTFDGHQGPITSVDTHRAAGPVDFSHLFLTSSFDWTVKLWSLKNSKPLYSFEDNGDYVYDVVWSPVHPALFACVDGMGRLDVWNLNNDTELPTVSLNVEHFAALNCVTFAPTGSQIAVGDDRGKIIVFDVGEQLAIPRIDEWPKFSQTLQELENNKLDQDVELVSSLSPGNMYLPR